MSKPPTNEPKMPEVLFLEPSNTLYNVFKVSVTGTAYHHDDKVNELRESLRECVKALKFTFPLRSEWLSDSAFENAKIKHEAALTKASNLLK